MALRGLRGFRRCRGFGGGGGGGGEGVEELLGGFAGSVEGILRGLLMVSRGLVSEVTLNPKP